MPWQSKAARLNYKDHYSVIIAGSGLAGLALDIKLKKDLAIYTDTIVYEKLDVPYGSFSYAGSYPGAARDSPLSLYTYSFAPSADFASQWASREVVEQYMDRVMDKYKINNVQTRHEVKSATWDEETGVWHVTVTDLAKGEDLKKTCNVFICATGVVSEPDIPKISGLDNFKGESWHSGRWRHDVDLAGKNVVVYGNGTAATQLIPELLSAGKVASVTQIADGRQKILPSISIPDSHLLWTVCKYIPPLLWLMRLFLLLLMELNYTMMDNKRGAKTRNRVLQRTHALLRKYAPKQYGDALEPAFPFGAERNIWDRGYIKALKDPKFTLKANDGITQVNASSLKTKSGEEVKADVIIFCTGFKAKDYYLPIDIKNAKGVSFADHLKQTGTKTFKGVTTHGFPNLFFLLGAGCGHTSVTFTLECQVKMILKLTSPIFIKLRRNRRNKELIKPAPHIEVRKEIEDEYHNEIKAEMKKKIWNGQDGSFYVDPDSGIATAPFPGSMFDYWRQTRNPNLRHDFNRVNVF